MSESIGDYPVHPVTERQFHDDGERVCMEYRGISIRQAYKMAIANGLATTLITSHMNGVNELSELAGKYADALIAEDIEHSKKGE